MVSGKGQKIKGKIKFLSYSSVHPFWPGLEDLPHPTLREDADIWEPQPLPHSSLHTQIPDRIPALARSPVFSYTELPAWVCVAR